MTTDRELLELAARAAGIVLQWPQDLGGADYLSPRETADWQLWNPLTDDGDALRLAVTLRLAVAWDRYNDCDYATATPPNTHQGYDCIVDQDPYAATRRAIVRAAAEIGKAMP